MAKLFYIESSPRKNRSTSIEIAKIFLDEYRKKHPQDEVIVKDLWKIELPIFDGDVIDAKYAIMHQQPHTEAQVKAWIGVEDLIAEFKSADKYVLSLPMWNFGIPYKLKHYIDILVQPGYTFETTAEGEYNGLVKGKRMLVIYSRGGAYVTVPGLEQLDLQKKYIETIFGFIGFQNLQSIIIEPTQMGEDKKKESLKDAKEKAQKAAAQF